MATLDLDSGSVTTESLDSSFESLDSRFWKRFPYACDDKAETDEDTPVNVDVLNNDSRASKVFAINIDAKGDGHGIWQIVKPGDSVTDETGATLTLKDDYTIDVDPNGKFEDLNNDQTDTISFKYGVYGPKSWKYGYFGWDDATVTVTVKGITDGDPENHAPVANDDCKPVYPYPYPYPYPEPYPLPLDSAQSVTSLDGGDEAASLDSTSADNLIYTTLAIGEEGDPDPYPVLIDVLHNDKDHEMDPLSIAKINGQDVGVGDSVTLKSGATVTVVQPFVGSMVLEYKGGILKDPYPYPLPLADESIQSATTEQQAYSLSVADDGTTEFSPILLPEPLPDPISWPVIVDRFTYQAMDHPDGGQEGQLSNKATVTVYRDYPYYLSEAEDGTQTEDVATESGADIMLA